MTLDLPLCTEDVGEVLNGVIKKAQLQNPEVTYQAGSKLGDGFLAVDTAVEIKDGDKVLYLFIKTAPKHEKYRRMMSIREVFQKEIYFYNVVQPSMEEFYKNKTGKIPKIAPKCFATNEEELKEIVVLENMKIDGYDIPDSSKFYDKELVKAILRKYGKYHGISFALREQNEDEFNKITSHLPNDTMSGIVGNMPNGIKRHCQAIGKYFKLPDDKVYIEKLKYIEENLEDLISITKNFQGDHRVVIHGDCNNNNYMFRKQEDNIEARLIDFQLLAYSSPISDLSYFFYSTSASEENLANFDTLLDVYYESLYKTVEELGCDPEKICPRNEIQRHWKVYGPAAFSMSLMLLYRIVNPNIEIDMVKVIEHMGKDAPTQPIIENEKVYAETFIPIFKHMVDKNIL